MIILSMIGFVINSQIQVIRSSWEIQYEKQITQDNPSSQQRLQEHLIKRHSAKNAISNTWAWVYTPNDWCGTNFNVLICYIWTDEKRIPSSRADFQWCFSQILDERLRPGRTCWSGGVGWSKYWSNEAFQSLWLHDAETY